MANLVGISFGNQGYKLRHIISDGEGNSTVKTSEIMFWIALEMNTKVLHIPISKYDMTKFTKLTSPQFVKLYSDRDRSLIQKNSKDTTIIRLGGIAKDT